MRSALKPASRRFAMKASWSRQRLLPELSGFSKRAFHSVGRRSLRWCSLKKNRKLASVFGWRRRPPCGASARVHGQCASATSLWCGVWKPWFVCSEEVILTIKRSYSNYPAHAQGAGTGRGGWQGTRDGFSHQLYGRKSAERSRPLPKPMGD